MKGKILITGATGNLGGLVIDALLTKIEANQIAGLVRDTNKAEALQAKGIDIREGNYDDESSLEKAFSGVEKIYFISGNDLDKRVAQHKNIVAAAEKAGFVLEASSDVNANPMDSADHPKGVWTLPPRLALDDEDREKYMAIGESNRMTLKFTKPKS